MELHHALLRPEAYPHPVTNVETRETHISRLYFAADRVYKVKKPIRLPFLDYTSLKSRRRFCEEEVRLNRRLADETYLGVVAITRNEDGHIRVGGRGEVLEYAVEMRRLPARRMLDALLEVGEVDNALLDRLVERLVEFHAAAASGPGISEHAVPSAVRALVLGNLQELEAMACNGWARDGLLTTERCTHLVEWTNCFVHANEELLQSRVANERIREGHGDLHTGNICVLDDRLVIYDCIEFRPAWRCLDVAAELAFLCMDLDLRGFFAFSRLLARRYREQANDPDLATLLPFYKVHFAAVRGKVALIQARSFSAGDERRKLAIAQGRRYLDLAVLYTMPPMLAITCGLPGSGKSTVARELARTLHGVVVRSDVMRKELAGIPPTQRAAAADEAGIYSRQMSDATYDALLEEALRRIESGRSVVVDAAFLQMFRRAPFVAAARDRKLPFVCVVVDAAEDVVMQRLERRVDLLDEPSDADIEVYRSARKRFEPPDEIAGENRVLFDGEQDLSQLGHRVIEAGLHQFRRLPLDRKEDA